MHHTGKFLRARSLAGVTLLGLATVLASAPAVAQSSDGESSGGLAEIVVTAQHREEDLQEVPIAVSAVTAEAMAQSGINATNELPQLVPSVQFTRSGPSGLFFIRGVGTTNAASGEDGANAIYVDDIYMPDLGQTINALNNIARVEVLKGPQGTLFGRNATGGLIHIITRDPGDEMELKGELGYGNFDTIRAKIYVGGPVTETLGWDLAGTFKDQRKGLGRNLTLNKPTAFNDNWGLRSKMVFTPNDTMKFTLSGDYFENDDDTTLSYGIARGTIATGGLVTTANPYDTRINGIGGTHNDLWGFGLKGEFDLDFAKLTSISGMRNNDTRSTVDADGGAISLVHLNIDLNARSYQQELRLASQGEGPLQWQLGAFYLKSSSRNTQQQRGLAFAPSGLLGINVDARMKTDSIAFFGEATYDITDSTHLTGGVRWTQDKRKVLGGQAPVLLNGTVLAQSTPANPNLKYSEVTYRASLRQDFGENINVYASVNRGFKAGAFSLQAPLNTPVDPQYIMAYELGFKSELFDRRLRLNLAAYHYDIDDYQIRSAATGTPGSSRLFNAAKVKVDGFEAEFEAAPTDSLRFFGGFTWLKSKFKEFGGPGAAFQAPIIYPNFTPTATTCQAASLGLSNPGILGSGTRVGGWVTCLGDVSGNDTPFAPKMVVSFGGSYTVPLGDESELRLTALYSYNDGYYFEVDNLLKQDSFSMVNASAEYKLNKNLGVEIWGRNLTDTNYSVQNLSSGTGTTDIRAEPRTYGVTLNFDF